MKITFAKLSNYVGQLTEEQNRKLDQHFRALDRDLQNIWTVINLIAPYIGASNSNLETNTAEGFSYIPIMDADPQTSATAYTGHAAMVFSTSDSNLRIYNTSDSSWKTVALS